MSRHPIRIIDALKVQMTDRRVPVMPDAPVELTHEARPPGREVMMRTPQEPHRLYITTATFAYRCTAPVRRADEVRREAQAFMIDMMFSEVRDELTRLYWQMKQTRPPGDPQLAHVNDILKMITADKP